MRIAPWLQGNEYGCFAKEALHFVARYSPLCGRNKVGSISTPFTSNIDHDERKRLVSPPVDEADA